MSAPNNGGPAFPHIYRTISAGDANSGEIREQITDGGMSLRDYLATAALTGMLANGFMPHQAAQDGNTRDFNYARAAYVLADAMLAERNK